MTTLPAEDKLMRIQGEYLEMPGLRLTPAQAQRLWGLDGAECEFLMSVLVSSQFLTRTRDGSYVRLDLNSVSPSRKPVYRSADRRSAQEKPDPAVLYRP